MPGLLWTPDSSLWTPGQLANVNFWYAADNIQLADNSSVTTWPDSGPNGYNLTTGTAPTFKANQVNGLPAVSFDGSTTRLFNASADSTYATGVTAFAVISTATISAVTGIVGGDTSVNTGYFYYRLDSTGKPDVERENVGAVGVATTALSLSTWTIISFDFQNLGTGSTWHHFTNGTANGTSTNIAKFSTTNSGVAIGAKSASATTPEWFNGLIAEVITYERVLSTQERAYVHSYLSNKYAIAVSDWSTYPAPPPTVLPWAFQQRMPALAGQRVPLAPVATVTGPQQLTVAASATQNQSATLTRQVIRALPATQAQTPTVQRALTRSLSITQAQSTTQRLAFSRSLATATQGQSATQVVQPQRTFAPAQGQSATLGARAMGRILTTTQGQTTTAQLALSRSLATASQGQTATQVVQPQRVRTGTQGQSGTLGARGLGRLLTATQGQSVALTHQLTRSFTASQAQSASQTLQLRRDPARSLTITHVAGFPVNSYNTTGTYILSRSVSPATVGDLLICAINAEVGAAQTAPSSATPSGGGVAVWNYGGRTIGSDAGNSNSTIDLWWGVVTATGAQTLSIAYGSQPTINGMEVVVDSFTASSGGGVGWALDVSAGNTQASTTVSWPSLTPTGLGGVELYWGYSYVGGTGSAGPTAGFTYTVLTTSTDLVCYALSVTANKAYAPTATASNSSGNNNVGAVLSGLAGQPQSARATRQIQRTMTATQGQSTLLSSRALTRALSATQAQSGSQQLALSRKFSATQAQTGALTFGKFQAQTLTATQAQTVTQALRVSRVQTASQAQSDVLVCSLGRILSATQAQSAISVLALSRGATTTQNQTSSQTDQGTRVLTASQGQTVTHSWLPTRTLAASQAQAVTAIAALTRTLITSLAQSASLARAQARSLAASQAQSATLSRRAGIVQGTSQGQASTVGWGLSRSLSTTQAQTPTQALALRRTFTATQGQSDSLIFSKVQFQTLSATQNQTAKIVRALVRKFSTTQTQSGTLVVTPTAQPPSIQFPTTGRIAAFTSTGQIAAVITLGALAGRSTPGAIAALTRLAAINRQTSSSSVNAFVSTASVFTNSSAAALRKIATSGSLDA